MSTRLDVHTEKARTRPEVGLVRVGIVGAGFMAKTHSLAYAAAPLRYGLELPLVERVRIADVDRTLADAAAQQLGWAQATDDWREITEADDIDLVDIVTPNHLHAEIAVDAARHGKHVLCEKPLAHTLPAARTMYRAVLDADVVHQVGFVFRLWPAMVLAKKLVAEGAVGRVSRFRASYFHDYALEPAFPLGWRARRAEAGAGSVGDLGSHLFDLARYLVGEITSVLARSRTLVRTRPDPSSSQLHPVDVDDATDVLLEFENGATGLVETNWMAAGYKTDLAFEISGELGAIAFTWRRNNELQFYSDADAKDRRGFRTVIVGPTHAGASEFWPVAGQGLGYGDGFVILVRELLSGIRAGRDATPSFLDGLRATAIVDAATRAATHRSWVEIPPVELDV